MPSLSRWCCWPGQPAQARLDDAGLSLLIGLLLFAMLLPLAMRGWLGGGDVKLIAAMAGGTHTT